MNDRHYYVIPETVFLDKELSAEAKMLYALILSLNDEEKGCYASNEYLGERLGISTRAVRMNLGKLKNQKYVFAEIKDWNKRSITPLVYFEHGKKFPGGMEEYFQGDGRKLPHNYIREVNKKSKDSLPYSLEDEEKARKVALKLKANHDRLYPDRPLTETELSAWIGDICPLAKDRSWEDVAMAVRQATKDRYWVPKVCTPEDLRRHFDTLNRQFREKNLLDKEN